VAELIEDALGGSGASVDESLSSGIPKTQLWGQCRGSALCRLQRAPVRLYFAGSLRDGHLSEKWYLDAHIRQRLFLFLHSFPSGNSFPPGPKMFEMSGFFVFNGLATGVKGLGLEYVLDYELWFFEG